MIRSVLVTSIVAIVLLSASVRADSSKDVAAPQFAVGDTWNFKRAGGGTYELSIMTVGDGIAEMSNSKYPNVIFLLDNNLVIRRIKGETPFDPRIIVNWQFARFPMREGMKFSSKVEGSRGTFEVEISKVSWEQVIVKAGTFQALRIESCWSNLSSGWSDCGMTHWYAPSAKYFVKRETPGHWLPALQNSDFEMTAFSVK